MNNPRFLLTQKLTVASRTKRLTDSRLKGMGTEASVLGSHVATSSGLAIGVMAFLVLSVVLGFTMFALRWQVFIPKFLNGNETTNLGHEVLTAIWMLSAVALFVLWRKRPHSILDLWLSVVMCVWLPVLSWLKQCIGRGQRWLRQPRCV